LIGWCGWRARRARAPSNLEVVELSQFSSQTDKLQNQSKRFIMKGKRQVPQIEKAGGEEKRASEDEEPPPSHSSY